MIQIIKLLKRLFYLYNFSKFRKYVLPNHTSDRSILETLLLTLSHATPRVQAIEDPGSKVQALSLSLAFSIFLLIVLWWIFFCVIIFVLLWIWFLFLWKLDILFIQFDTFIYIYMDFLWHFLNDLRFCRNLISISSSECISTYACLISIFCSCFCSWRVLSYSVW